MSDLILREPGEFTFSNDSKYLDIEEYAPRKRYFLNLVCNEVPEFFRNIIDEVMPTLYRLQQKNEREASWQEINEKDFFSELKNVIIDLSEQYNLIEAAHCEKDWISIAILEEAHRLIRITNYGAKEEAPGSSKVDYTPFKKEWALDDIARKFMEEHRKELSISIRAVHLTWDPLRERKKERKKVIMEEVEKELDMICEFMKKKGFVFVKRGKDQFRDLVLFQVKEMTFEKIADLHFQEAPNPNDGIVSEGALQKAVSNRAEEIELKRRTKF